MFREPPVLLDMLTSAFSFSFFTPASHATTTSGVFRWDPSRAEQLRVAWETVFLLCDTFLFEKQVCACSERMGQVYAAYNR